MTTLQKMQGSVYKLAYAQLLGPSSQIRVMIIRKMQRAYNKRPDRDPGFK